jgi:pentatricopeptide repeat protein
MRKCGDYSMRKDLENEMIEVDKIKPTVSILSTLISSCISRGEEQQAEKYWMMFEEYDIQKDEISYNQMMMVYSKSGNIKKVDKIFREAMSDKNVKLDYIHFTTLMDAFSKIGDIKNLL